MARAPFAAQGSAEIPSANQSGGFSPAPDVAEALNAVASTVLPAIKKERVKSINQDVNGQTDAIQEALALQASPFLASSKFTEEALQNPHTKRVFEEFNKIQAAVTKGKLPAQFALERLAVLQNDAIAAAPEFEREIRGAYVNATGQDPEKSLFQQFMSTQAASLSIEEKARQREQIDAEQQNITVEELRSGKNLMRQSLLLESQLKLKETAGTLTLRDNAKRANNLASIGFVGIMSDVKKQVVANGGAGLTPAQIAGFNQRASAIVRNGIVTITDSAPAGSDPQEIENSISSLRAWETMINEDTKGVSIQTIVGNSVLTNKALLEAQIMKSQKLAFAWTFGGQSEFLNYVKIMGTSPAIQGVVSTFNKEFANQRAIGQATQGAPLITNLNIYDVAAAYETLGNGNRRTVEATNNHLAAAKVHLRNPQGSEENLLTAHKELKDVDKAFGTEHFWTAYATKGVELRVKDSPKASEEFKIQHAQQTAGLAEEYAAVLQSQGFNSKGLVFTGSTLQYVPEATTGISPNPTTTRTNNDVKAFVRRFNRANGISAQYGRVGVLPKTDYGAKDGKSATQNYFGLITEASKALQPPSGTVKWVLDDNGKPVPAAQ